MKMIFLFAAIIGVTGGAAMAADTLLRNPISDDADLLLLRHEAVHGTDYDSYKYDFILARRDGSKTLLYSRTVNDNSGLFQATIEIKATAIFGPMVIIVFNQQGKSYANVVLPFKDSSLMIGPHYSLAKPLHGITGPLGASCNAAEVIARLSYFAIKLTTGTVSRTFVLTKIDDGVFWVEE